jgi:hypothetical protein
MVHCQYHHCMHAMAIQPAPTATHRLQHSASATATIMDLLKAARSRADLLTNPGCGARSNSAGGRGMACGCMHTNHQSLLPTTFSAYANARRGTPKKLRPGHQPVPVANRHTPKHNSTSIMAIAMTPRPQLNLPHGQPLHGCADLQDSCDNNGGTC